MEYDETFEEKIEEKIEESLEEYLTSGPSFSLYVTSSGGTFFDAAGHHGPEILIELPCPPISAERFRAEGDEREDEKVIAEAVAGGCCDDDAEAILEAIHTET